MTDPEGFMYTAFKIAELARDANNLEMDAETLGHVRLTILAASVELAHAVYGEFYAAKGDI